MTRWSRRVHWWSLLLLAMAVTLHTSVTQPLTDAFQEAEYATFGTLAADVPGFHTPLLIHGGLDTAPSRLAAAICRADTQIVCVRSINLSVQLGASVVFVGLVAALGGLGTWGALLASLPAAGMLWFYDGPNVGIVDAHQGTPSVRDVSVLAGLLVMASLCRRLDRGEATGGAALFVLGVLTSTGVFWAYNRGLVLVLLAGLFMAWVCWRQRSVRPV